MFIDEARMAAGLHHRNILQIVDFDRFDGWRVPGHRARRGLRSARSCSRTCARRRATRSRSRSSAELGCGPRTPLTRRRAADGQPLNLVHRDVSPSNVLLGRPGEMKLSDFGVAKARLRSYHTVSGTIKGKAPYMAPEQILGEHVDRRADVFSLGVLLFEVTTRARLYSGKGDATAMKLIIDGVRRRAGELRPGYPAGARGDRPARARSRSRRALPTARAMVDDLDRLARAAAVERCRAPRSARSSGDPRRIGSRATGAAACDPSAARRDAIASDRTPAQGDRCAAARRGRSRAHRSRYGFQRHVVIKRPLEHLRDDPRAADVAAARGAARRPAAPPEPRRDARCRHA